MYVFFCQYFPILCKEDPIFFTIKIIKINQFIFFPSLNILNYIYAEKKKLNLKQIKKTCSMLMTMIHFYTSNLI